MVQEHSMRHGWLLAHAGRGVHCRGWMSEARSSREAGGGAWMHGTMIHVGPHKVGVPCAPQHLRVKAVRIRNPSHRRHVSARKRRMRGEDNLLTRHTCSTSCQNNTNL